MDLNSISQDAMLCRRCRNLRDAVEERIAKLTSTAPMLYWKDPLNNVSPILADHIRQQCRMKAKDSQPSAIAGTPKHHRRNFLDECP
jgi:hypothetical protein